MSNKNRMTALIVLLAALVIGMIIWIAKPKGNAGGNNNTEPPQTENTQTSESGTGEQSETGGTTGQSEAGTAENTGDGASVTQEQPADSAPVQLTDNGDIVIELEEGEETFGE